MIKSTTYFLEMKKVRAANKAKLKSLEWTDEAIEQLTYANPQARCVMRAPIILKAAFYFLPEQCAFQRLIIWVKAKASELNCAEREREREREREGGSLA